METILEKLSTQQIFRTGGIASSSEDKQNILNRLNRSSVDVNVLLGRTDIMVRDFIDLKIGDVLRLDNSLNDNLIINVNNIPKVFGRPGLKKNKVAITISDDIKDTESLTTKK